MPRILVTVKWLGLQKTSEGLCSLKMLLALADSGYDVVCLTADRPPYGELAPRGEELLASIRFVQVDEPQPLGVTGRMRGKLEAARNVALGLTPEEQSAIPVWLSAIREAHEAFKPDYWYIRSAGWMFAPHHAASELYQKLGVEWIAHVHDPWPGAALPIPYRHNDGWKGWTGLRQARKVLESATVVTVPHERLGNWMQSETSASINNLSSIPHIGYVSEWFGDLNDSPYTQGRLVHTGLLSRQRDPSALLEVLAELSGRGISLTFRQVGKVDSKLLKSERFRTVVDELRSLGLYQSLSSRVSYHEAMQEMKDASCSVVLSPGTPESPFFPAKLADALSIRTPILPIAPAASVVQDLLGLSFDPDDLDSRGHLIEYLETGFPAGQSGRCVDLERSVRPESVISKFKQVGLA